MPGLTYLLLRLRPNLSWHDPFDKLHMEDKIPEDTREWSEIE